MYTAVLHLLYLSFRWGFVGLQLVTTMDRDTKKVEKHCFSVRLCFLSVTLTKQLLQHTFNSISLNNFCLWQKILGQLNHIYSCLCNEVAYCIMCVILTEAYFLKMCP